MTAKKSVAKKTKKPAAAILVGSFEDLPHADHVLAAYGVPKAIAPRGYYVHLAGISTGLFAAHPERTQLAAAHVAAAMALVGAIAGGNTLDLAIELDSRDLTAKLGLNIGFHCELDAADVAAYFAGAGFRVFGPAVFVKDLLETLVHRAPAKQAWRLASALVAADAPLAGTLNAVAARDDLGAPPATLLAAITARIAPADLPAYRKLLELQGEDLVTRSLPLIERLLGAKRGKRTAGKLPGELATLLAAFAGIPALGVMTAAEVARTAKWHVDNQSKGGRPRWDTHDPRIRGDRYWQAAWTPFWTNGGGDYLCIDNTPNAAGRAGQIIGVWHDPPGLHHVAGSLGDWLWDQLAINAEAASSASRRGTDPRSRGS